MAIPRRSVRSPAIHPGEFLLEDYMRPNLLTVNGLAIALRVPATRISEIVNQRRGVSTDTAIRLGLYFGTSTDFWVRMQAAYDMAVVEKECMARLKQEIRPQMRTIEAKRVA